jgi:hypothetical protein
MERKEIKKKIIAESGKTRETLRYAYVFLHNLER